LTNDSENCKYSIGEYDLFNYCPKVSKKERNAGCEEMEEKEINRIGQLPDGFVSSYGCVRNKPQPVKNNHPCCKPISLNEKILRLFKTPNPQRILIPFAGSGSEIIGAIKAGFTDWTAVEINEEYVKIAEARIKLYLEQTKLEVAGSYVIN
jgi:site-specific DNA-methyltransferase (adenine-specific)